MREQGDAPIESAEALAQVMGMHRYELTEFEGRAWRAIMKSVPKEQFLAFLQYHVATSGFAPKPNDATRALDLTINPDVAYAKLERLVAESGPYSAPDLPDDPVLVTTVLLMGGWLSVNEHMPDPANTYAARSFKERFVACFNQAVSEVRIQGKKPQGPLLAYGASAHHARALEASSQFPVRRGAEGSKQ